MRKLELLKDDVLWIDIDCELLGKPVIPDPAKIGFTMKSENVPHAFVIYFPYNDYSFAILNKWIDNLGELGDHDALASIFDTLDYGLLYEAQYELVESGNWEKSGKPQAIKGGAL